jgi:hypothetical protein
MKKLFFFALPLVLLVACKNNEQYRTSIEELSGNWDTTTKAVTDFSGTVSNDMTNYTQSVAGMTMDESAAKKMTPEQMTAIENAKKGVTDALGAYVPFQQTINDFVKTWAEKSAELTSLKDELAGGKLQGDPTARITDLNNMVTTANENLKAWQATYSTIKGGVEGAMTTLKQVMSGSNPGGAKVN